MNEEQWNELVQLVRNHTPGPWEVGRRGQCHRKINGIGPIRHVADQIVYDTWIEEQNEGDAALAASAPDLLAEIRRLRGWMTWLLDADDYNTPSAFREMCRYALSGAEVPK